MRHTSRRKSDPDSMRYGWSFSGKKNWWDKMAINWMFCYTLARIRRFATFARTGGGGGDATPLGISKRSVVELRGKDPQFALAPLAEYSRLVVLLLVLGQYLTQLSQVKGKILNTKMSRNPLDKISSKLKMLQYKSTPTIRVYLCMYIPIVTRVGVHKVCKVMYNWHTTYIYLFG